MSESSSWADMFPALEAIVTPLRSSGWAVVDDTLDTSVEPTVAAYMLERDGFAIEVQCFGDGTAAAYEIGAVTAPGEAQPALVFSLDHASPAACADAFAARGWLA